MEYSYENHEHFENEVFEEFRIFFKKKDICIDCKKKKRKFVVEFAYYDKRKKYGTVYKTGLICETCFELYHYTTLIEKFYGEKIFKG